MSEQPQNKRPNTLPRQQWSYDQATYIGYIALEPSERRLEDIHQALQWQEILTQNM